MICAAVSPLPGHAVFLLLIQLALLLIVARVGALLSRAIGLPAVVGELAAGIVLGPTVFGHYAPALFVTAFPQTPDQFHLLEAVGALGMVLLLLLTGLETDLLLLKNLGRAAVVASVLGMLVPFVLGFGLGLWMPDQFLAEPGRRTIFAAFLATAMAISAMPVIAKILMDLELTRRNIGLVILSAGVVDDTAGWLVLSVIAGAATQSGHVELLGLALTIVSMFGFLAGMALVAYPSLRLIFRVLARAKSPETELVVIVAFTFVAAALTEQIGIHAVFGAFIAGTALRQVPTLKRETLHRLESFVFAILAPIFFGTVGLKVDLWSLAGGGGTTMLGVVLAIACLGKLVGCTAGGLWGGLSPWEAISIAVAMNARGAMELVVASIGLSLGILNSQMFSIIVVVAITTSFLAPIGLRITMRMVKTTRDEEERMLAEASRGVFDAEKLRVLVPTAGGPNALVAAKLAYGLVGKSTNPVEIVYVDEKSTWLDRVLRAFGPTEAGKNIDDHIKKLKELAGSVAVRVKRITGRATADAVAEEARRDVNVILVGASGGAQKVGGRVLAEMVDKAPCHVAVVKAGKNGGEFRRLFVPIDGSAVSRDAAELAVLYAESTGATLTLGLLSERRASHATGLVDQPDTLPGVPRSALASTSTRGSGDDRTSIPSDLAADSPETLARISPVFRVSSVKPIVQRIDYDPGLGRVADEIVRGGHDLVVLGAENRAVRQRLFFGHENERILELDSVTTVILVPERARRH